MGDNSNLMLRFSLSLEFVKLDAPRANAQEPPL